MQFSQATMNDAEKNIVRRAVAFKLSLPLDNVIEKVYNVVTKQLYLPSPGTLPLIISPLYTNPNFPDMLSQASTLINSAEVKAYIKSKMSTFIDTPTYAVTKYPIYTPFLARNPEQISDSKTSLAFQTSLSNYGFIYAIAVEKPANDTSNIPSPYQIWKGYDARNNEVKHVVVPVLEPNIIYKIVFDQLKPATIYSIYVTAGSNHPNFPDLLGSGATVSLEASTKDPSDEDLDEFGSITTVSLSLIFLILSILY